MNSYGVDIWGSSFRVYYEHRAYYDIEKEVYVLAVLSLMGKQESLERSKTMKQLTEKLDDTPLHSAARVGNLELALKIISNISEDKDLKQLLSKANQSGETALYVAAKYGNLELVKEMIKYCDLGTASIKARNGCDAFHISAKQGDLGKCLQNGDSFNFIIVCVFASNVNIEILSRKCFCIKCLHMINLYGHIFPYIYVYWSMDSLERSW